MRQQTQPWIGENFYFTELFQPRQVPKNEEKEEEGEDDEEDKER